MANMNVPSAAGGDIFSLLEVIANPEKAKARLAELLAAKEEAVTRTAEMSKVSSALEESKAALAEKESQLGAKESELAAKADSLGAWKENLAQLSEEHAAALAAHAEKVAQFAESAKAQNAVLLKTRTAVEAAKSEWESFRESEKLRLTQWENSLVERENALATQVAEHADKVSKLRELVR